MNRTKKHKEVIGPFEDSRMNGNGDWYVSAWHKNQFGYFCLKHKSVHTYTQQMNKYRFESMIWIFLWGKIERII